MPTEAMYPSLQRQVAAGAITQAMMNLEMARDILRNYDDYEARPYPQPSKEMAAYIIGRCSKTSLRSQALARSVGMWVGVTYDLMAYNAKSVEILRDDAETLTADGEQREALAAIERCMNGHKRAAEGLNRKLLRQADMCMSIEASDRNAGAPSVDGPTRLIPKL